MGIVISENQNNALLLNEGLLGEVELQRVVCDQTLTHLQQSRVPPHHVLREPVECGVGSWGTANLEQGMEQVGEHVLKILHALVGLENIKQSRDLDQPPYVV